MSGEKTAPVPLQQHSMLPEILSKKLVIVEVSDGNIYRNAGDLDDMEFSATRVLLDMLLRETAEGILHPKNFLVDGWRPLGNGQWRTTSHLASFAIAPPTKGNSIRVALDVDNMAAKRIKPRLLSVLLDGRLIGQTTIAAGRREVDLLVPNTAKFQDPLLGEISLLDPTGEPLRMVLHGIRIVGAAMQTKSLNKPLVIQAKQPTETFGSTSTINLISNEPRDDISVEGLSGLENNEKESWRWALGPKTRIKFYIDPGLPHQARQLLLQFGFKNGASIPDQTVTIRLNGKEIRRVSSEEITGPKQIDADAALTAKKGLNVLEIIYQDWNRGKKIYAAHDPRELAVVVMRLALQEARAKE
jgi:hypothetical protein